MPTPPLASFRNRVPRLLVGVAMLALVVAAAYFAYTSQHNRQVATQWKGRATQLDHLLTARTAQLGERDAALNRTTSELASLNGQVSTLESRQRNLVSQKARVEDQRGLVVSQATALAQLAALEHVCNVNLTALFNEYAAGHTAWATTHGPTVQASCTKAQTSFDAFRAKYAGR